MDESKATCLLHCLRTVGCFGLDYFSPPHGSVGLCVWVWFNRHTVLTGESVRSRIEIESNSNSSLYVCFK